MSGLPKSSMPVGPAPERQNKACLRLVLLLTAAVLLSAVLSILVGPVMLSPSEIIPALLGRDTGSVAGRIVLFSRLPRTCASLLSGAALAVSGAVIQSVLFNPLAAPNVIGVNTGAGLAVAVSCALVPGAMLFTPVAAFLGALAGVLLVLLIGERAGASRLTLVLSGIAVSAVFSGAVDLIVTFVPDALNAYSDFRIGGFSGVTMRRVVPACAAALPALLAILALTGQMDILALGTETAHSLGLRVHTVRIILLSAAAALAGAAVSVAGLLGFVGLIVPHAVRRFSGGESLPLVVYSALGGGAFVTLCDLLARTVFAPYELPVGVVLSFLGGPFFLWLILRQRGGHRDA